MNERYLKTDILAPGRSMTTVKQSTSERRFGMSGLLFEQWPGLDERQILELATGECTM